MLRPDVLAARIDVRVAELRLLDLPATLSPTAARAGLARQRNQNWCRCRRTVAAVALGPA